MVRISLILLSVALFAVFALASGEQEQNSLTEDADLNRLVRSPGKRYKRKSPSRKRSKKNKKKKGSRNGRKNGNRRKAQRRPSGTRSGCGRQSGPDDGTCMANIGTAMLYEGVQIANFKKQKKRIETFDKLITKKGAKKDNFGNITSYMTSSCSNSASNSNDSASTLATLSNCSASISDGCTVPTVNTTGLASCETSFEAVETKNAECYALLTATSADLSAACTCYAAAAALVETTKELKCSAKDDFATIKASKSACLDKFSGCKQAEDASIGHIAICQGKTTPAPITTTTVATTTAAATTAGATTTGAATTAAAGATTTAAAGTTGTGGCKCGVEKTSRIVGGTEVTPKNKYPWMVYVRPGNYICGGTLVASKYVVTAAHCLYFDQAGTQPMATSDVQVTLGEHDLQATGEGSLAEKTVAIAAISRHESYNAASSSHDIAVLELAEEVDLDTYTPACMAQTSDTETFYGKDALVYGWGTTSSGGASSSVLLEVAVPVVTPAQCATSMGTREDGQLCAGGVAGKDSCQGDSGGPLTYKSSGQHILIGEVSFGNGCAQDGYYGVYGRISYYRTWIEGKMTSPKYCPSGANAGA